VVDISPVEIDLVFLVINSSWDSNLFSCVTFIRWVISDLDSWKVQSFNSLEVWSLVVLDNKLELFVGEGSS